MGGRVLLLLGLLALAPAARQACSQESDSTASGAAVYAEARVVSRYVWRGYDLSRGKPAFQPYVAFSLPNGMGGNAFTTAALDRRAELDEFQLGLDYRRDVAAQAELSAGYLAYLQPGTETEPTGETDPLAFSSSGEVFVGLTRNWEAGYVSLTYFRGHGASKGNGVNLWAERRWTFGDGRGSIEPYLQVDFLDQFDPPTGLGERLSGVEVGVPLFYRVRGVRVTAAGYLTYVPSGFVRGANRSTGGASRALVPWAAVAVVYQRE